MFKTRFQTADDEDKFRRRATARQPGHRSLAGSRVAAIRRKQLKQSPVGRFCADRGSSGAKVLLAGRGAFG
jgi:hypothetical protein